MLTSMGQKVNKNVLFSPSLVFMDIFIREDAENIVSANSAVVSVETGFTHCILLSCLLTSS